MVAMLSISGRQPCTASRDRDKRAMDGARL